MKKGILLLGLLAFVVFLALLHVGLKTEQKPVAAKPKTNSYVLPSDFFLKASASRGVEGETYLYGSTNLPDGLIIEILAASGVSCETVVQSGVFTTPRLMARSPNPHYIANQRLPAAGNSKYLLVPLSPGKKRVHYLAYFTPNRAKEFDSRFQRPEVLEIVGNDGRNLNGKLFKLTDPDVIDSPKVLDYSEMVDFPALTPPMQAVNLVKRTVLTVDSQRSSADIGENLEYYMSSPGLHRGPKGWTVRSVGGSAYEVSFDYVDDGSGHQEAIWSVNLATGQVRYVNRAAKIFSWTPSY